MPRADPLFERTVQGWRGSMIAERQRFAEAFLRRRCALSGKNSALGCCGELSEPPLAAPVDPASFAISKTLRFSCDRRAKPLK